MLSKYISVYHSEYNCGFSTAFGKLFKEECSRHNAVVQNVAPTSCRYNNNNVGW